MRTCPGPRPSAALASANASAAPPARGLQVEWVDVEGGAATLIVTPAGESVLIYGWNGGRDADRIKAAATRAGITRIDHLVITHWHQDHVGGVADLAQRLPVAQFYDHGFPDPLPDLTPEEGGVPARDEGRLPRAAPRRHDRGEAGARHAAGDDPRADLTWSGGRGGCRSAAGARLHGAAAARAVGRRSQRQPSQRRRGGEVRRVRPARAGRPDAQRRAQAGLPEEPGRGGGRLPGHAPRQLREQRRLPRRGRHPHRRRRQQRSEEGRQGRRVQAAAVARQREGRHQLHRNVETTAADNAPATFVANDDEACQGQPVRLQVDAAAKTYTVEVPSKGTRRTYEVK